jgi:hypothetical protein
MRQSRWASAMLASVVALMCGCTSSSPDNPQHDAGVPEDAVVQEDAEPRHDGRAPHEPKVGGDCYVDADCPAGGTCFAPTDGFPGGYCVVENCASTSCPAGAECVTLTDGVDRCIASCGSDADCRVGEGYTCQNGKCWFLDGAVPVGGSCYTDTDCYGGGAAACYRGAGFVGGYCLTSGCPDGTCPAGSHCVAALWTSGEDGCLPSCVDDWDCREGYQCVHEPGSSWDNACSPGCATDADCPGDFVCRDNGEGALVCIAAPPWCSTEHPTGDCDAGYVCQEGSCQPFTCSADSFEANDTQATASALPASDTPDLTLCQGDADWFSFSPTAPSTIYYVGRDAPYTTGDIDLNLVDGDGKVIDDAAFYRNDFNEENPVGPANVEATTIFGALGSPAYFARVFSAASVDQAPYTLLVHQIPYQDGARCEALYSKPECRAATSSGAHDSSKLIVFPVGNPLDTYAGTHVLVAGTSTTVPEINRSANRYARREAIMIVRNAIHAVETQFPGTAPLGIGEIGLIDGTTPWGHPNGTHYYGANLDLAYYIQPEKQHGWGNLTYRSICCDAATIQREVCVNTSTGVCNPGSETTHIVDLPRTAHFLAKLAASGRLRVVGIEATIEAAINAELLAQKNASTITAAEYSAITARIATANDNSSWVWHFHHLHASFCNGDCSSTLVHGVKPTRFGPER